MSFGVFEVSKPLPLPGLNANSNPSSSTSPPRSRLDADINRQNINSISTGPSPKPQVDRKLERPIAKGGQYKFINSSKLVDLKADEHRKTVRSQAARLQPLQDEAEAAAKAKRRRRHARHHRTVTFRIDIRVNNACQRALKRSEESEPRLQQLATADIPRLSKSPDGGWPMPFAKLANRSQAFTPGLMHHCES